MNVHGNYVLLKTSHHPSQRGKQKQARPIKFGDQRPVQGQGEIRVNGHRTLIQVHNKGKSTALLNINGRLDADMPMVNMEKVEIKGGECVLLEVQSRPRFLQLTSAHVLDVAVYFGGV